MQTPKFKLAAIIWEPYEPAKTYEPGTYLVTFMHSRGDDGFVMTVNESKDGKHLPDMHGDGSVPIVAIAKAPEPCLDFAPKQEQEK